MADYDDLNTNRIFIVGIISIVVTAVTALAVQVVYYSLVQWHETDLSEKSSYRRQNKVIADQAEQISKFGVDPQTGNITIPVSKAMQLIAADNDGGESQGDQDVGHDAKDDHNDDKETHVKGHDDNVNKEHAEGKSEVKHDEADKKADAA